MLIDHGVLTQYLLLNSGFIFHGSVEIEDVYSFTFLRLMMELNVYATNQARVEVIWVYIDDVTLIPKAMLCLNESDESLANVFDRYEAIFYKINLGRKDLLF